MEIPIIHTDEGKLKWLCNKAFFGIKSVLPKGIRESGTYDVALAFTLGAVAGYGAAEAGEALIQLVNNQGANLPLEGIVSHSLAVTVGTPAVAYLVAPGYLRNFIRENKRYSAGVIGVMAGASLKAILSLYS